MSWSIKTSGLLQKVLAYHTAAHSIL